MKVKNVRIARLKPIVHDLALHFHTMNLEWIVRDENKIADRLARLAAENSVQLKEERSEQPSGFKVEFSMQTLMGRVKW